jgi:hypothetical protein
VLSDEFYKENHSQYVSHSEILDRFDSVCNNPEEKVSNEIRLQYLFWVANVASKSNIEKDNKFYLSCMKELLNQSQKFLKFN